MTHGSTDKSRGGLEFVLPHCAATDDLMMKNCSQLTESQYNQQLDDLMLAIEDAIEHAGLDIDYETSAGILTLTCADNSKVILSRQTPLRQLWIAARSGGFHFNYDQGQGGWLLDGKGETFTAVLNRCLTEQADEPVQLAI